MENLYEKLVKILKENKQTISCMESCTGGLLNSEITNVDGSSEVLKVGLVTYSNEYKIKFGIESKTIENFTVYSREVAREAGNHSVFAVLDEELLSALSRIDELERQIVAKLNKEIDFDKMDADRRMTFMLEENSDKTLENEMLNVKLNHSFDEFISLQNQKQKDIDSLNKQRENLEKRLQELEGQAIPDALEIGRTKRELEEINKKIEKLQKEVDKMRSIANIKDPQDIKNYIEKNNRIINNNFKNMKLKGIKEGNYAVATDLLRHLNDSDKMKAQYDHSSLLESQHEPFKNILTPQEFSYLSKMYEKQIHKRFGQHTHQRSHDESGYRYRYFYDASLRVRGCCSKSKRCSWIYHYAYRTYYFPVTVCNTQYTSEI